MLQNYSLEGFKSFKHYTEVDMKKTQYQTLEKDNVVDGILKGCMFVGGNASGKTNVIEGLRFLLYALFSKADINYDRFLCLFSDGGMFENTYEFRIDGHLIRYQIRYQKQDALLVEYLYVDQHLMMERIGTNARSEVSENKFFTDIPGDSLFLRDLWFNTKFRGHEVLQRWFEFLNHSKYVNPQHHLIISFKDGSALTIDQYVKKNGVEALNGFFRECGMDFTLIYQPEMAQDGFPLSGLYMKRDGIEVNIPMSIESLGNKTLMMILPAYLSVIQNGGLLICDEFSSALHNDLEELLVKYFMKHSKQSQMMIVSHSTNLLSSSLFRPDQLYAVNFDSEGSNLVRFSSEQPRTSQNYEKMYLGGVFSGLPRYNEI
jgi:hypothetical protein